MTLPRSSGVFNLLSSRANLHLLYNHAGRSHCRLQNHHRYHSSTLALLHLRHSSFSNHSGVLLTSQLILQPFRCFTYAIGTSPTSYALHLRHRHFTYVIGTSPTSQFILEPFRRFTYITAHSTTLPLLQLRHKHFTYATAYSSTIPPLHLRHS